MSELVLKNRVKELRARLNLRQADLAREVNVTRQTILAIEKGRLNPSILVSLKIARILREPVGYVFYLDHESATRTATEAATVAREPQAAAATKEKLAMAERLLDLS
ncbi:MAG: helix-turn-helix transcriptional regulator [Candidatus Hydrogenedentes bacterium]|nr:helix-turn-helix transcriptional regulator [Candidatus Hydrogenedentota bacterium]